MTGNNNIERKSSITFLGRCWTNISWIHHERTIGNKIAKHIGLLYHESQCLNKDSLRTVYFLYIHLHFTYAHIAWVRTYAMKLKRHYLKQKHAVSIVFNKQ